MAKIVRKAQKIFAGNAINNGVFGSAQLGTKVLSNDLDDIQSLAAWENGWNDATISADRLPTLEEMQGIQYVATTQIAYLLQEGVAEYDADTTYYENSIVKKTGTYELYGSLIDDNVGNALPAAVSDANWQYLGDLADLASATDVLIDVQVFTANGTWNRPAGCTKVRVIVVGGGGGGGQGNNVNYSAGGGAGAGGASEEVIDVTATASVAVTVGAGATSQATGGTSSFGAFCQATGGVGGLNDVGGTSFEVKRGAAGGLGSGGDINTAGGPGTLAIRNGATSVAQGGNGGNSIFGGGGRGSNGLGAGENGQSFGAGGGGGCGTTAGGNGAGGTGGNGVVIVYEYR